MTTREIKFRAWHTPTNTMYWFDIMNGNRHGTGGGYISMAIWGEPITEHIYKDNMIGVDPTECIIMQFTGLLDKNGKEIYEGDIIVKSLTKESGANGAIGFIEWSGMASQWWIKWKHNNRYSPLTPDYGDSELYCQYLEITGNIHTNPELIKP